MVRVLRLNDDGPLQAPAEHGKGDGAAREEDEAKGDGTQVELDETVKAELGAAEVVAVED